MKVRELGQNPISPDNPSGNDAHYEPEFEQLQQEIDKLSIVSAAGDSTDWKKVTSLSVTILSEKSKDLLVAVYLVTGLTKTHGFEGFAVGVAFLKDLVENFWETMYPPKRRMRGRLNALSWWIERMQVFLKSQTDQPPIPQEQLEAVRKNLDALDQALSERSEDAPSMRDIGNYLNLLPVAAPPEPEPAPEPPAAAPPADPAPPAATQPAPQPTPQAQPAPPPPQAAAQPAASPPPPVAGAAPSQSRKDADQVLKDGLNQLLGVADFYLNAEPANPLSYRLRRFAAWLPLSAPPPADNGKTRLPPPDSAVKTALEHLLQSGNNAALLQSCETRVTEFRFWLDLTRLTATALENLGAAYADALDGLRAETLLFVQRLAGVENLSFADGTPFADQETRSWLQELHLGKGGDAAGGGDPTAQAVNTALQQAHALLKDKKGVAGAELLQQGLAGAGAGRERLLWRLAQGRFLLLAGKPELAESVTAEVLAEVERLGLESWDPPLALRALGLAREAVATRTDEGSKARAAELLQRIARVDMAEALRLFGQK